MSEGDKTPQQISLSAVDDINIVTSIIDKGYQKICNDVEMCHWKASGDFENEEIQENNPSKQHMD
ncbi:imidazole glycerol phosphate synthase subunit HisH [Acrasis kona]|uniref:Imidazole glycerol phosphate synthase subunit HisH n=1 Tax=Acrasis kona TaxID=1008807 RepID=A0AAW2ZLW2_9EUKA